MAVPLLSGERALGVLEVLDRPSGERFTMEEADLLGHVRDPGRGRARPARAVTVRAQALDDEAGDGSPLTRLAAALESADRTTVRRRSRLFRRWSDCLAAR